MLIIFQNQLTTINVAQSASTGDVMDESAARQALLAPHVQVMARAKFAELVGVSEGVVDGWIERGYLKSVLIGKHRLVNMVELSLRCLTAEE